LNTKLSGEDGGFRLPTEAEWEYACRAGKRTASDHISPYGGNSGMVDREGADSSSWSEKRCTHNRAATHPVGQKAPNGFGLYDMIGNVWEWCEDWYGDYPLGSVTDPPGPSTGTHRVFRGGSWRLGAGYCRAADRYWCAPNLRDDFLGFRLARTSPQAEP
jgi:formylglycine-generating enzyme required for sulfatase activity